MDSIDILCKNVSFLRRKHALSKKVMAQKLGIGVHSLSLIENGVLPKRLTADVLIEIFYAFGITPERILSELIE